LGQINALYFLVKEGQDKRQYVDKNIRDFYRNKKWMSISLWYVCILLSRNEGWNFGKLGQVLERADKTSRVLDAKYHHLLESPNK
jgi:uncharacterized alpha-E superfamily protein